MTSQPTRTSRQPLSVGAAIYAPWLLAALGIGVGAAGYLWAGVGLVAVGAGAGAAVFRWSGLQTQPASSAAQHEMARATPAAIDRPAAHVPAAAPSAAPPIAKEPHAAQGAAGQPHAAQSSSPAAAANPAAPSPATAAPPEGPAAAASEPTPYDPPPERVAAPSDVDGLVEQMLAQGRFALLLRPQIIGSLTESQRQRAQECLMNSMAIVPAGEVALGQLDAALDDGHLTNEELLDPYVDVIQVDGFYLDRYPVTNRQFQQFVQAGGYEQMAFWEPEVWPAVLDFVDRTGLPGPRVWHNGRYERGSDDHPVVGICWYEAAAYARWSGKRLATDAEWVKAGSWPVNLPNEGRMQRKYPWGNVMDRRMANLWGSGPGRTSPVTEFAGGVSVGGVYQLIGNVWEWTFDDYEFATAERTGSEPWSSGRLKSLRGGAFDTYFDAQATCHFQSADMPLARKHNVGFRCALGLCDLTQENAADPGDNHLVESDSIATEEAA